MNIVIFQTLDIGPIVSLVPTQVNTKNDFFIFTRNN